MIYCRRCLARVSLELAHCWKCQSNLDGKQKPAPKLTTHTMSVVGIILIFTIFAIVASIGVGLPKVAGS